MKELWIEKNKCTGCSACADACSKNAIIMEVDKYGFWYPRITSNCIECNLCEVVCNNRTTSYPDHFGKPETYAAWSKDENIRYCSTSGGVFSELASIVLSHQGVVVGAAYNSENLVEHVIIDDIRQLPRIRQSKYIQSSTVGIYKAIKQHLLNNKTVLFCGAPCQVAALKSYLKKRYDNLITIDFICRGMNSPKAYSAWLKEIINKEGAQVTRVWFKYKEGGWKTSPKRTRIDFDDGHWIVKEGKDNLFMHGYLTSNLYIRPCCGKCDFKGVPRPGDITVADFWGVDSSLDDDKGTSLVLINSHKGLELFEQIKSNIVFTVRNFDEIFAGNVCFRESVVVPSNSFRFLAELDDGIFSDVLKKYTRVSVVKKVVNKIKSTIKKLHETSV